MKEEGFKTVEIIPRPALQSYEEWRWSGENKKTDAPLYAIRKATEFVDLHVFWTYTTYNPDIESDTAGVGKEPVSVSFPQLVYIGT